jgi:hypothetical protein
MFSGLHEACGQEECRYGTRQVRTGRAPVCMRLRRQSVCTSARTGRVYEFETTGGIVSCRFSSAAGPVPRKNSIIVCFLCFPACASPKLHFSGNTVGWDPMCSRVKGLLSSVTTPPPSFTEVLPEPRFWEGPLGLILRGICMQTTRRFGRDKTFSQPIVWVTTFFIAAFHVGAVTALFFS